MIRPIARVMSTTVVFALLGAAAVGAQDREAPASPVELDLTDLFGRFRDDAARTVEDATLYRTTGLVRRTRALDATASFALLHPIASCCPNGIAVGFRVRSDAFAEFEDGARVVVSAHVRSDTRPDVGRRSHVSILAQGILRKGVFLEPLSIERYERLNDPTLHHLIEKLASPSYETFRRLVEVAGFADVLREPRYLTVLAPTEHAFGGFSAAELDSLLAPANRARLRALVARHVIAGRRTRRELFALPSLATVDGQELPVAVENGAVRVAGARVLFEDASPRNGVVLSVDRVLRLDSPGDRRPR